MRPRSESPQIAFFFPAERPSRKSNIALPQRRCRSSLNQFIYPDETVAILVWSSLSQNQTRVVHSPFNAFILSGYQPFIPCQPALLAP